MSWSAEMVHSIELLFDADTDAAIRRVWQELADAGLPSQAGVKAPTNRPHVTLLAATRIEPAVDSLLAKFRRQLPLRCVIGAPLLFGGSRFTLARLVVPSHDLLSLQERTHHACLPHLGRGPAAHCAPGQWTPHTTLCRRLDSTEVGRALTTVRALTRDRSGRITGLRRWDGDARVERMLIS